MAMDHWTSEVPEALQLPGTNQLLSYTAITLLIFVTAAVAYLSIVEWSDRRRRKKLEQKKKWPAFGIA